MEDTMDESESEGDQRKHWRCSHFEACFGYPCSPERGCPVCSMDHGQSSKARINQVTDGGVLHTDV